jgi:hypothetical protein
MYLSLQDAIFFTWTHPLFISIVLHWLLQNAHLSLSLHSSLLLW